METPTLRPKRDGRTLPRIPPSDIAHLAYEFYTQRGGEHGHDVDDWLQAEGELRKASSVPARAGDVWPTRTTPEDGDVLDGRDARLTIGQRPRLAKADLRTDERAKEYPDRAGTRTRRA